MNEPRLSSAVVNRIRRLAVNALDRDRKDVDAALVKAWIDRVLKYRVWVRKDR